jgi:hypothetical protein
LLIALALRVGCKRHDGEQEGIQQMTEEGMHGIFAHAVALGLQVLVQPVDTEAAGRVAQALAHQPAQRGHLRDLVALHHIAEEDGVHVALKQLDAQRCW